MYSQICVYIKPIINFFRFLYCSPLWGNDVQAIDEAFGAYIHQKIEINEEPSCIHHITTLPHTSKKQQFILLSTISNYHWYNLPSLKASTCSSKSKSTHTSILYSQHILHDPTCEMNEEGLFIRQYIPVSPRNRVMYLTANCQDGLYHTVKECLKELTTLHEVPTEVNDPPTEEGPPRKKVRKQANRVVSVTARDIFRLVGADMNSQLNCASQQHTLYTKFSEKLVTDGIIKWRQHTNEIDVCIMSDYNPTGHLLPQSFVHVYAMKCENAQPIFRCTCQIYNLIERAANQDTSLSPDEHNVPDDSLTCMHCRFFNHHLMNAYEKLQHQNTNLSTALSMVQQSLQYMNDEILLLGNVLPHATTKYSVKGNTESYSIVHINFHQGKCYAKCTEGMCCAAMHNKSRIPKTMPLSSTEKLCIHMNTFNKRIEYIKSFFLEFFNGDDTNESTPSVHDHEEINTQDIDIGTKLTGKFNVESGLWDYQALSHHKPSQMMDTKLILNTEERNKYITSTNINDSTGLYGSFEMKPAFVNPDGTAIDCQCGSQFSAQSPILFQGSGILYTRMGAIQTHYYNVSCHANECILSFTEEAEKKKHIPLHEIYCMW